MYSICRPTRTYLRTHATHVSRVHAYGTILILIIIIIIIILYHVDLMVQQCKP
jgi:hypothetical protein